MNETEVTRTHSMVVVKPSDDGKSMFASITGIPAGGTGATEAEAIHSLARVLGDFVMGHKRRIEELVAILEVNGIEPPGMPGEPTPFARGVFAFGQAIHYLKGGRKVARQGWNGKGMWLVHVSAAAWSANVGVSAKLPFIAMKTADDRIVPWLASQTDMLAADWVLVD